ncbi:peptidylprolyl isomerase [Desulfotomaculum sp. 1211_IL3151]|uniref:peptidylprolyl isomerase n=1 Tax=Desulfotomaculum sp. 1211_IL3151 TaxID=3084055 RepID=UPI002FDB0204
MRLIKTFFFVMLSFFLFNASAFAQGLNIVINGVSAEFSGAKPYLNEDGRAMVPIRFISEKLGANVKWDNATQSVVIDEHNAKIVLPINKQTALINGIEKQLDSKAVIKDGFTMVPLRFVSDVLGAKVLYSNTTMSIRISTEKQSAVYTADRNNKYKNPPQMFIDKNKHYEATVKTNRGSFKIDFFAAETPSTVNNFIFLAKEGFYNGVPFHRIIKDFMVQTGDPLGNGTGGPGYKFNDELPPPHPYASGMIAMANSGPNTNGSQFFICTGEQAKFLNNTPNYTVFGQIIEGMEVVRIISDTPVVKNDWGELSQPMEQIYINNISIVEK